MKPKVFIDGSEGTTGLQIHERLAERRDIDLLCIERAKRKETDERKRLMDAADLVFLCLPDTAAKEAAKLAESAGARIIDASSAHRVAGAWVYGLPELQSEQKERIQTAKKVSNPGCHATGAVLLLAPIVEAGLVPPEEPLSITSVTGYTGGGKDMINTYENTDRKGLPELDAPRLYALTARHKHIPEIMRYSKLKAEPAFMPIVADYPQGMQVIIPLHLPGKRREVFETLSGHYENCPNIDVSDSAPKFAPSNVNAGSDRVALRVLGHDDIIILTAQFDNLGKGASGAAVQNMNIMLGFDEYKGLKI